MSTTTVAPGSTFLRQLFSRIYDSNQFVFIFGAALFGGAALTILTGLAGLTTWIAVVITLVVFGSVNLIGVGWLFAFTAAALLIFDVPFGIVAIEGGGSQEEESAMRLTSVLCLVCMMATGAGAYGILTNSPLSLALALLIPLVNLGSFVWAWIRGIRV